ncbi:MAG: 4Fe-4S dicluster domain-containing protein, partial [Syntrophomonadaceae bacterium]|nr:4Fe-4S dicluster domain-containing protein [Syntrophomonadaceae bacterium]
MARMTNLYDVSKCTACRGCQVACKDWNQLPAVIEPFTGNYQTHESTNGDTYTIVKFIEHEDPVEGVQWNFLKFQCMHCFDPACMQACPRNAISQTEWGAVIKDYDKCIGCQYCTYACPFEIPKYR